MGLRSSIMSSNLLSSTNQHMGLWWATSVSNLYAGKSQGEVYIGRYYIGELNDKVDRIPAVVEMDKLFISNTPGFGKKEDEDELLLCWVQEVWEDWLCDNRCPAHSEVLFGTAIFQYRSNDCILRAKIRVISVVEKRVLNVSSRCLKYLWTLMKSCCNKLRQPTL